MKKHASYLKISGQNILQSITRLCRTDSYRHQLHREKLTSASELKLITHYTRSPVSCRSHEGAITKASDRKQEVDLQPVDKLKPILRHGAATATTPVSHRNIKAETRLGRIRFASSSLASASQAQILRAPDHNTTHSPPSPRHILSFDSWREAVGWMVLLWWLQWAADFFVRLCMYLLFVLHLKLHSTA